MRDIVNTSINQIGLPAETIQSNFYWSGSERTRNTRNAFYVNFHNGNVNNDDMDNSASRVRSVLAF